MKWSKSKTTEKPKLEKAHSLPLAVLVVVGTVIIVPLGATMFLWLAWLQSHQPAPWRDKAGLWAWLGYVHGEELFSAARTSATILAILGLGAAALVVYRRQSTAELSYALTVKTHQLALEAQTLAGLQWQLDSQKYELDRERHKIDETRRRDDRERELRSRFASIAEQLASESSAVKLAGAYALAALADDWHQFGNDAERQVCVNLLCAQLRSPRLGPNVTQSLWARETEVRRTMVAILRSRRPVGSNQDTGWNSCALDLSGAELFDLDFSEMNLRGASFNGADLTHGKYTGTDLSQANLRMTNLRGTHFENAILAGTDLFCSNMEVEVEHPDLPPSGPNFTNADLNSASFWGAQFTSVQFTSANLANTDLGMSEFPKSDFKKATLTDASLIHSNIRGSDFTEADVSGTNFSDCKSDNATFDHVTSNEKTKWPQQIAYEDFK